MAYGKQMLEHISKISLQSVNIKAYSPNEITPTAWKKPELTKRFPFKSPLESEGTRNPCITTVTTMTSILTRANAEAFAN